MSDDWDVMSHYFTKLIFWNSSSNHEIFLQRATTGSLM